MDKIDMLIAKWGKQADGTTGLQNQIKMMQKELQDKQYKDIVEQLKRKGINTK